MNKHSMKTNLSYIGSRDVSRITSKNFRDYLRELSRDSTSDFLKTNNPTKLKRMGSCCLFKFVSFDISFAYR